MKRSETILTVSSSIHGSSKITLVTKQPFRSLTPNHHLWKQIMSLSRSIRVLAAPAVMFPVVPLPQHQSSCGISWSLELYWSILGGFILVCALWFQRDFLKLTRRLQVGRQLHWLPPPGFLWLVQDSPPAELTPASPEGRRESGESNTACLSVDIILVDEFKLLGTNLFMFLWVIIILFTHFLTLTPAIVHYFLPAVTGRAAQSPSVQSGWCRPGSAGWSLGCVAPDIAAAGPPDSQREEKY